MASYIIEIRPAFRRELKKLPPPIQAEVIEILEMLQDVPFPTGFRKVEGNRGTLYRIRIAKYYRLIYAVDEEKLIILAVRVGPRKEVYRQIHQIQI
ncbi:Plasmid stabilization system [Beggiatoa sp. PS]|nr:Plasmid stabilization system [Beggiatoa sp. PS]